MTSIGKSNQQISINWMIKTSTERAKLACFFRIHAINLRSVNERRQQVQLFSIGFMKYKIFYKKQGNIKSMIGSLSTKWTVEKWKWGARSCEIHTRLTDMWVISWPRNCKYAVRISWATRAWLFITVCVYSRKEYGMFRCLCIKKKP